MALTKLWTIAYRDLGRNRRRTFFTMMAVAVGLALLFVLEGFIAGIADDSLQNTIRLQTGHVQVRAADYEEKKVSLLWADLLENAGDLAARAAALPEVQAASPELWATVILNTVDDSTGLRLYGIDPASAIHDPIRESIVAGDYLSPDDRSGILIGKRLADDLGVGVGQNVNLTVIDANGQPVEGIYTVRGLFTTGALAYDESSAFMPLDKAQAFTGVADRASAVVVMLHSADDADAVAAALAGPGLAVKTWQEMNALAMQLFDTATAMYKVLDGIVIVVVAVVIANTLLMIVFERIREMGILAALGMKGRQIVVMFLLQAATIGVFGILIGAVLGLAGVYYLATSGYYIGDMATSVEGFALGSTMYATFVPGTFVGLSLVMLGIILLAALYPAWFAARLEPVDALKAQ